MRENIKSHLENFPLVRGMILTVYQWLFAAYLWIYTRIQKHTPVLIYQFGKVGSSSLTASFPVGEYDQAIHLHMILPEIVAYHKQRQRALKYPVGRYLYDGLSVYYTLIRPGYPTKVITPVRDPISRNISAFFQSNIAYLPDDKSLSNYTIDELQRIFLESLQHERVLEWFDKEFMPTIGVNIYDYEFPKEKGYQCIQGNPHDILLYKLEIDDRQKETAIAEFLGVDDFSLATANIGSDKSYADVYQQFKKKLVLPADYIEQMLESKYTRHFYSEAERDRIREKWLTRLKTADD